MGRAEAAAEIAVMIAEKPKNNEAAVRKKITEAAVKNATDSLALERSLQPGVADTRTNLSNSISDQLKLGGQLNTDTINAVTQAGRVAGGTSGSLLINTDDMV